MKPVAAALLSGAVLAARVCAFGAALPAVEPMKPWRLAPRVEWRLNNGLTVILARDGRVPMLTAKLAVRSGRVAAEDAGLAEAMAGLLGEGTARRDADAVALAAEECGGSIAAWAGPDELVLGGRGLSEFADRMLGLLAEMARRPAFPEAAVEPRRAALLDELHRSRAEPDFLAGVALYRQLFGFHPYGVTAPTEATLARLSRPRLLKAHRRLFVPRNAVLVLAGDLAPDEAKRLVRLHFGSWRGPAGPGIAPAAHALARSRRVFVVDRPGSAQTVLRLGNLAIREDHPDYFAYLAAVRVLADRLASDGGGAWRASSRAETRRSAGVFLVRVQARNEFVGPALDAVLGRLERLGAEPVSESELERAKNRLAGEFVGGLESQESLAAAVLHARLRGRPPGYLDTFVKKLLAVRAAQVRRAASAFIRPAELAIVAVGDAEKIKEPLARFSSEPVALLDEDGN
ncbi:MAG: pitrilysin family protein [Elusimicrobia bacterium]|nr:pitrilysin family protein [Elusimicrobiota bacterium]